MQPKRQLPCVDSGEQARSTGARLWPAGRGARSAARCRRHQQHGGHAGSVGSGECSLQCVQFGHWNLSLARSVKVVGGVEPPGSHGCPAGTWVGSGGGCLGFGLVGAAERAIGKTADLWLTLSREGHDAASCRPPATASGQWNHLGAVEDVGYQYGLDHGRSDQVAPTPGFLVLNRRSLKSSHNSPRRCPLRPSQSAGPGCQR